MDATVPEENWHQKLDGIWEPGEKGATTRLDAFLSSGLQGYAEDRNRPDLPKTSMLSPHIRFGEISIRSNPSCFANSIALFNGMAPRFPPSLPIT